MVDHVLVPFDASPAARTALEYAIEQFPDASMTVLYVINPVAEYSRHRAFPGYADEDSFSNEREKGEYLLNTAVENVPEDRPMSTELVAGEPARAIVDYADEQPVDQIVIGSHGRSGVSRFLLGSTAETVVRRAGVPVTVVRPNE